jgi:Family of unknown function (DUF6328)
MSKKLDRKLKMALDETRLLFLGGQVLLGFQFQAVFQEGFSTLSTAATMLSLAGVLLMVASITLIVSPVMQHRLVEHGNASKRLLRVTTKYAAASLAPLAISLALATYVVISRRYGDTVGLILGLVTGGACVLLWYGIEAAIGLKGGDTEMEESSTPLSTKVEQLLTEARLIIPGGQALFGFQFIAMLTKGFDQLPETSQVVHTVALSFIALTVVVLMTPAALHRLSFGGEDSHRFLTLGSRFVIVAPMLLSLGIAAELYVVFGKVTGDPALSAIASAGSWVVMTAFWYVIPLLVKQDLAATSAKAAA